PLRPAEAYGLSKQLSEDIARSFARDGLEIVVLRPGLIVFPDMRRDVLARANDVNDPDLWWYVEPEDAAMAFRLAAQCPSARMETAFIGAANTFSPIPTLELVRQRYGHLPEIRKPEMYRDNPHAALFDISGARDVFGFAPKGDWRTWSNATKRSEDPRSR